MTKVTYIEDASLAFPSDYPTWVRLHTRDGWVLEHKVLKVVGSSENPMPAGDYEKKFFDNACHSIDAERATELISRMRDLPVLPDLAELAVLYS